MNKTAKPASPSLGRAVIIIMMMMLGGKYWTEAVYCQTKVGTTAADFLMIPVGPRASGMGGAFTATANDVTSAYWNAAGLSRIGRDEFTASFSNWIAGTKLSWFGLNYALDEDDAIGLSINQLDYGQEEITTEGQPNGTGQYWSAADIALGLSYSRNLTDRFSVGGTVKYINEKIYNESASAFALDVGLLFYTQLQGLRIGMNISNFGTEMQLAGQDLLLPGNIDPAHTGTNNTIATNLQTDSWPLPLIFTVGLGYDVVNTDQWDWTVATDAVYPNNQSAYLNLGSELSWSKVLYLRGGYYSLFKKNEEGGLSAGVGVKYDFGSFYTKVDYSYTNFGIFDPINRISISIGL